MFKVFLQLVLSVFFISATPAQDLLKERIWKISDRKRSVFLDRGVFHSDANPMQQSLKDVRNSYVASRGYERVVFDFTSAKPPRVYGKISNSENKVYLDFFNTSIGTNISELKNIKFLKNIDFFTIDEDNISVELQFKQNVSFDIFYLENPGRLVVDVKK